MQGFWASCLSRFEKELPAQQFNTWIRPLKLDASAAPSGELRLLAPNRFVLQWVKDRFAPRIEAMGAEFFSSPIRVSITLESPGAPEPTTTPVPAAISDVIRAYQQKSFDEFKRYYHSLDLLLIDDIQFFTGKDRTQEEFFYAFNALIEAHKQLIITCDTYPKDLAGIDERLKSRFSWGLTVAIEPPEQEMRVAIILKKAEAVSLKLSEEVAFFIAKHIRSNVRELEGALKSVIAYSRFNGRDITLDTAKEALKDLLTAQNRQITVDNIQKTVAEYYKIKVSDMHSKKRSRNVARPRQLAMALAKDLTQMSLPDIGDAFGNRDHTTVLHACRTIATLREKNHDINRDYHVLEQVLKG